jgi:GNAT superfamily N-acetyltransferase
VISAWHAGTLVGLGNAISDGALVVYYPHLLVRPAFHRQGIGRRIIETLQNRYAGYHQQVLLAVKDAVDFYQHCGFQKASSVEPMWICDDSNL